MAKAVRGVLISRHSNELAELLNFQSDTLHTRLHLGTNEIHNAALDAMDDLENSRESGQCSPAQYDDERRRIETGEAEAIAACCSTIRSELASRFADEQSSLKQRQAREIADAVQQVAPTAVLERAAAIEAAELAERFHAFQS